MAFLRPVLDKAVRAHTDNAGAGGRIADAREDGAENKQEQTSSVIMSLMDELEKQGVDASEHGVAATVERLANQVIFLVSAGAASCTRYATWFLSGVAQISVVCFLGNTAAYCHCAVTARLRAIGSSTQYCMVGLGRTSRSVLMQPISRIMIHVPPDGLPCLRNTHTSACAQQTA